MTNNKAEALALFIGIHLAHFEGIQKPVICEDSMMIIQALVNGPNWGDFLFGFLFFSIEALKNFNKHSSFHIKREQDTKADKLAKAGSCLGKGMLMVNGITRSYPIP
jgi:ribonuclease HI